MSAGSCIKMASVAVAAAILFATPAIAAEAVSLRSFAAQQVRLAAIADRIGEASAKTCDRPRMVTGMLLHDLSGYDPAVRNAVASAFSMNAGVGVIQIVPGSPADRAGVRIDDEILAIGNESIVDPAAAYARRRSYARTERVGSLLDAALSRGPAELLVRRAGSILRINLSAERGCGGQLSLSNSGEVNAWSDGEHVMVTTAMMNIAQSTDELAFVIAHEMAHNILGHSRSKASGIFGLGIGKARGEELAADRMAVQLMSSAGYRPSGGLTFLERVRRRFWWNVSLDHPGFGRRIKEVNSAMMALGDSRLALSPAAQPPRTTAQIGTISGRSISEASGPAIIGAGVVQLADATAARETAPLFSRKSCLP